MAKRSIWKPVRTNADAAGDTTQDVDEPEAEPVRARRLPLPHLPHRRGMKKDDPEPVAHSHAWSNGASLTTRGASLVTLVALACGPVALMTNGSGGAQQSVATSQESVSVIDQQQAAAAGQTGLDVVQAWLSATKSDHAQLDALMGTSSGTLGDAPIAYSDAQVASVLPTQTQGVWTVIVTALVSSATTDQAPVDAESATPIEDASSAAPVRMAWQVPIRVVQADMGLETSAVTWPAPTTLSQVVTGVPEGYGPTLSTTSPLGQAVQELLTAYVTGADVTRLTSPDTKLSPLPAGVYVSASLTSLSAQGWDTDWTNAPPEGQTIQVMATATLTSASQSSSTSSWALTLKARAGRWEVLSIDLSPASVEDDLSSTSTPTLEGDNS